MSDCEALAVLLRNQVGVLSREQALATGVTKQQIRSHLRTGRWRSAFPGRHGVYVIDWGAAPLSYLQRIWATVLAVGGDVVVSHESSLWLAKPRGPGPDLVHVAVVDGRSVAPLPGVRVHTLPTLGPDIVQSWCSPRRVRLEVAAIDAAHLCPDARAALAIVYAAAGIQGANVEKFQEALVRRKRHRHRRLLNAVLLDVAAGAMSGLEREHLTCMRRHALPEGIRQRQEVGPDGTRHIDVIVETELDAPLVTELDGRRGHDLAVERWRDMDRDNLDEELGRGHLRYGAAAVFGQGCLVARQTRRALTRRGWPGQARRCGPICVALD